MINFDANASYGLLPEVKEALEKFQYDFQNPSAIHQAGQAARAVVEMAREELSDLMHLSDQQRIVFTSGATEANNQAVMFPFLDKDISSKFALTQAVEHPCVLEQYKYLETRGLQVKYLSPKESIEKFLQDDLAIVSVMFANNETGEVYPVRDIFDQVKKRNPKTFTHTDAVQALGKVDLDFSKLNSDLIAISGHKIGALSGVGALIVNDDLEAKAFLRGGPQEQRYRAGTENLIGIYSLGLAARVIKGQLKENIEKMLTIKENLLSELGQTISGFNINSHTKESLPNTLSIMFPGIIADDLVVAMDLAGIAISSGSACASGKPLASHVLLAHGQTEQMAKSTIRLSWGASITNSELEQVVSTLVKNLKSMGYQNGS